MPPSLRTLDQELSVLDPNLVKVFKAIAKGIAFIAVRKTMQMVIVCTKTDHTHIGLASYHGRRSHCHGHHQQLWRPAAAG